MEASISSGHTTGKAVYRAKLLDVSHDLSVGKHCESQFLNLVAGANGSMSYTVIHLFNSSPLFRNYFDIFVSTIR